MQEEQGGKDSGISHIVNYYTEGPWDNRDTKGVISDWMGHLGP